MLYKATELNLRSKGKHWAKHTIRHPGEKSHGANIRGKTDYSATIRFWHWFWSKVGTPSALHALNPQWHTTRNYEEPDQTCRCRPQGYSQPMHILLRLKCDLVLFFSSLSDSVWCREVNKEGKLLSPFYSSYFFWLTRWQPRVSKWDHMGGLLECWQSLRIWETKNVLTTSAVDSKWKLVYWWRLASWWTHSGKVISVVTTYIKTYNALCDAKIEVTT